MPEERRSDLAAPTHAGGGIGSIGSVINFLPNPLPDGGPFQHNDEVDPDETNLGAVDEHTLPHIAFAEIGVDGNRTTWGYGRRETPAAAGVSWK